MGFGDAGIEVLAEVGFIQEDDGSGAAAGGHEEVAFEEAGIEAGIEGLDEEGDFDVGGEDLFSGFAAGDLAGEVAGAGEDFFDDGL